MLTESADAVVPRAAAAGARPDVLILTEDSKPQLGGIAEYLHRLALVLGRDCDVRIVSSVAGTAGCDDPALPFRYIEVPWFRASERMPGDRWLPVRKLNTLRWMLGTNARVRGLLRRVLGTTRPDVVLLGRLSPVTHPWCAACESLGLPYDVLVHGLELLERHPPRARARQRRYLERARRVFVVSTATAELARAAGARADRMHLMSPGIDPDSLEPPPPAARALVRRGLALEERRFLLSVCSLRYRKGIDLAIAGFAGLAARYPDVDYCIVGDGPERAALESLAAREGVGGRVRFAGAVDDRTKLALLRECEALVMPNRLLRDDIEGFGIVFLEAAVLGKPVVGGDNGGVRDAVEHGVTGLLVDTTGDATPIADALDRLLADPAAAAALGRAARERALSRFRWEVTAMPLRELAHQRRARRTRA